MDNKIDASTMKHSDMEPDKSICLVDKEIPKKKQKADSENKRVYPTKCPEGYKSKNNFKLTPDRKPRRNTIQYKLVLDAMLAMKDSHPSAPEIHKEISKIYPGISNATVYGQMRRLEDEGIIRVISCLGSADRFDAILDEHYHIKCEICGAVCDLVIDLPNGLNEKAAKKSGYLINGKNIIFSGICPDCQKLNIN